ncbi:MAG: polysaccharide biosynthesis/export family protein, partial [Sediminibacterium sp.]
MRLNRIFRIFFLVFIAFLSVPQLYAQDILKAKDLSQLKVDQLSDADIAKLKAQLTAAKLTVDQAEQMALSRGMPATEVAKLRQLLLAPKPGAAGNGSKEPQRAGRVNNSSDTLDVDPYGEKKKMPLIDPLIFGSELYTGAAPSFEPNLKIATPLNYILGPDDELEISLYGIQQYEGQVLVSPEGTISIPNVGQIKVAGMTIEAATQRMKTVMGNTVYPY